MPRNATVIAEDGLRLRESPSTTSPTLGLLGHGEMVTITGASGRWRRIETRLGAGYSHGDYLSAGGRIPVNDEQPPLDPEIRPEELVRGDDRVGGPALRTYLVQPGDSLSAIGAKLGVDWHQIAATNGLLNPYPIFVGQLLKIPGAVVIGGTIEILNPLAASVESPATFATSSSNQAHHTPYGGNRSCDIAFPLAVGNPGKPAHFLVRAPDGVRVRGRVFSVQRACASQVLADGGDAVKVMIERAVGDADFRSTGAWVLYGHLSPVLVTVGQLLEHEALIGKLGAENGTEYDAPCARGSHTHLEATNATWVCDEGGLFGRSPILRIGF